VEVKVYRRVMGKADRLLGERRRPRQLGSCAV
jgi:hypothetical protein